MVTSRDHVCGSPEAMDLYIRQPGDRAALFEAAGQCSKAGVPSVSFSARLSCKYLVYVSSKIKWFGFKNVLCRFNLISVLLQC